MTAEAADTRRLGERTAGATAGARTGLDKTGDAREHTHLRTLVNRKTILTVPQLGQVSLNKERCCKI